MPLHHPRTAVIVVGVVLLASSVLAVTPVAASSAPPRSGRIFFVPKLQLVNRKLELVRDILQAFTKTATTTTATGKPMTTMTTTTAAQTPQTTTSRKPWTPPPHPAAHIPALYEAYDDEWLSAAAATGAKRDDGRRAVRRPVDDRLVQAVYDAAYGVALPAPESPQSPEQQQPTPEEATKAPLSAVTTRKSRTERMLSEPGLATMASTMYMDYTEPMYSDDPVTMP